ncbi:hypothetical protein BsIDN1_47220 [Bacillus safensis]|uniref:Uncharacterized protein n=1 Tax=Bacillus safensis TaxID=561879 RepID=A0A5S9MG33_BACIA|nr:hypothetical protein BsIDN1_47220 [Bacillus safensis]
MIDQMIETSGGKIARASIKKVGGGAIVMQAVIVEAKRTPFGDKNGMLKNYRPEQLAAPLFGICLR